MTPTLAGRIQTRLVLLATVGLVWTILIVPFLPGATYGVAFTALILTAVFGVVPWEPVYHLLQQFRWEKDWPAIFAYLSGLPEGLLILAVLQQGPLAFAPASATVSFWLHFGSTWTLVWFAAHGPMRVVSLRWRYRGGRLW
jgi:hypothetical protein